MASVKTDLGYIHGAENLIQWVNENSNTYHIKNHGDLYYWVKLAGSLTLQNEKNTSQPL